LEQISRNSLTQTRKCQVLKLTEPPEEPLFLKPSNVKLNICSLAELNDEENSERALYTVPKADIPTEAIRELELIAKYQSSTDCLGIHILRNGYNAVSRFANNAKQRAPVRVKGIGPSTTFWQC
jgi:hypothetical protein